MIIEALKKPEDSDSLIRRLYESEGSKSVARISWSETVDALHEVDLLETSMREVLTDGKGIQVPVTAYS